MNRLVMGVVVSALGCCVVSPAFGATITLYSVADAEITGRTTGNYVNTHNWGDLEYLVGNVNKTGGPTSAQFPNFGDSRGLFEFDLSAIPAGAVIDSAMVSLYVGFNAFSPLTSRLTSVSVYQVTSDWTESGVTYDTRPTWNTASVGSMSIPAATGTIVKTPYNGYINTQITNLVQGWVDGSIVNNGLITSDTYTTAGLLRIYAHEAGGDGTGTDPRLVVQYTVPDPPVAAPEPTSLAMLGLGVVGLAARRRRNKTT